MKKKKLTSDNIITLPKELRDDIRALELGKTNQSHAFKFVHLVLRDSYYSHYNYISYSSKSQKFITKVFDKKYNSWLRPLKEAKIIICDDLCSKEKNKSYYYAVNSRYFTNELDCNTKPNVVYEVYKDVIKNIDSDYDTTKMYIENDLSQLNINYEKFETLSFKVTQDITISDFKINEQIDKNIFELFTRDGEKMNSYYTSKSKAIEKAKELGKIIINSNQKFYMMEEAEFLNSKKYSTFNFYMDCINKMREKKYRFGINSTNNRLDHNLTNMPTILVDEICKDNNLLSLDLSNSQFTLLCLVLKDELKTDDFKAFKELAVSGQLYESMKEKLGLKSRDEAKTTMFELLFSSHKIKSEGKTKLKELFPSLINWIDNFKAINGYESFSIMLQKKESDIFIIKLWNSIKEKGLFCIPRHDSLLYKMEDQNQIESYVTEYFIEIGLDCHLKLSDGRKIRILKEIEINNITKEVVKLHTKEEIKVKLCEMINRLEFANQKSAINMMLEDKEDKPIEYYNEMYLFIKNKEILSVGKTG